MALVPLPADPDEPPAWEPGLVTRLAGFVPAPPPRGARSLLARVWAAPVTLLGTLVGLAGARVPRSERGVLVFAPVTGPGAAHLRRGGYRAMALGHSVLSRDPFPGESLWAHELAHVRQAERFGPFFVPLYLGLLAIYGYRHHPLERAARVAGRRACEEAARSSRAR